VVAEAKKGERKGECREGKNREFPGDAIIIIIICKALFLKLYYMNQPPLPTNTITIIISTIVSHIHTHRERERERERER